MAYESTKTFNYNGIEVKYDSDWDTAKDIMEPVKDIYQQYKDKLDIKVIDFSQYDLNYCLIDDKVYKFNPDDYKWYPEKE